MTQVGSLDCVLGPLPKPPIVKAPKLKLNILPAHLRYVHFGTNETFHVILSADLFGLLVEAALRILKRRKKAICWEMTNILVISPALCMHRIYMVEDYKFKE